MEKWKLINPKDRRKNYNRGGTNRKQIVKMVDLYKLNQYLH